ncbi:hypothetical protein DFJ75_4322 [Williamsia muralis]|uniref:Uncharacterized protein n=2 Tax=Williamsia marianensis TaxID=85044 RepID=A0A495K8F4_WILMA|nr:hypothetical protein DFJ75_4322 [Williamsia muralis]
MHYWKSLDSANVVAMNNTPNEPPLANLAADAMRIGPAPTQRREVAVIIATVFVAVVILVVTQPGAIGAAVAAVVIAAVFAGRWTVGTRKWGQR